MKIVSIQLDKERHLRLNYNAICLFEEINNKPISEIAERPFIRDVRALLYAGLKWEDKSLTLEKIGELLDEIEDMTELQTKLGEAIKEVFNSRKN